MTSLTLLAALVLAQTPPQGAPAPKAETPAEKKLREQRALLLQMLELDKQRIDLMLRYLGAESANGAAPGPEPRAGLAPAPAAGANTASGTGATGTGWVSGRVTVDGDVKPTDVYVYVRNVRGPLARSVEAQIVQKDKRFTPEVLVIPRGARVTFPNTDAVYHNVFSPSPVHPFDLGTYRAGDKPRSVTLAEPGVLEVFCNIHARMRASILVVPNAFHTRVAADGTFRLERVPAGKREIVAWSPHTSPVIQTVTVGAEGAAVTFSLRELPSMPHNDKDGRPYKSYE